MRLNRILSPVLLMCILQLLCLQCVLSQCKSCKSTDRLCGPKSLLAVCEKLGVKADLDELIKLSGHDGEWSDMKGLQSAARAKGLEAFGAKISLKELAEAKVPAIALLWGEHFVALEAAEKGWVRITEPGSVPELVTVDSFKEYYSGFALLIWKDNKPTLNDKAKGPDLRFDEYVWETDSPYEGDKPVYSFKCRNVGKEELVMSNVDFSCNCMVPLNLTDKIPAGGEGEIKLLLDTSGMPGPLDKKIHVTCNDPITPVIELEVSGYVKRNHLSVSPSSIAFATRRSAGETRRVFVPDLAAEPVKVTGASVDSPYIDVRVVKSDEANQPGYYVEVGPKADAPIGKLSAVLTVDSNHAKDPKASIPITLDVLGDVEVDHDSFFFGLISDGEESKSAVTIMNHGGKPLKITGIDNDLRFVSVEQKTRVEGKEYVLTAHLSKNAPVGSVKGVVTVHTDSAEQPEIKLSVVGLIEGAQG